MRLLEFQAKRIFKEYGIAVPNSTLIVQNQPLPSISAPVVLKAQVAVGGRGKAGAIQVVRQPGEIPARLAELFAMQVKGHPVQAVLAEDFSEIQKECYLAVLIDKARCLPVIIASGQGGVEIEEVARTEPEKIIKRHVDPIVGLQDFTVRYIARGLDIADWKGLKSLLEKMLAIVRQKDATLVEINPLAMTPNGLLALDAKMTLDDKAGFRRAELFHQLESEQRQLATDQKSRAESLAAEREITYVPLGGDIGFISDGAGTGMLTIDLITEFGGKPANFCELGGLGNAERMSQGIEIIFCDPNVKVLLIALIGGLTRMDDMANGIAAYLSSHKTSIPIVVRMCGTEEKAGKEILRGVGIDTFDDLAQAVKRAVALAKGL